MAPLIVVVSPPVFRNAPLARDARPAECEELVAGDRPTDLSRGPPLATVVAR